MKNTLLVFACLILYQAATAQVTINRYDEPTISVNGFYGKTNTVNEIIIPGIDAKKVIDQWEKEKQPLKFAEPIPIDISPFQQGSWERTGDYSVNRIKITAEKANSIMLYFDKLHLSKNTELYLYNAERTIITGPVTETENISGDRQWGSNVFPGTTIIIELKILSTEEKLNELHIQKILYGIKEKINYAPKDSLMGPGYGTSSACNINVVCSAGSGWSDETKAVTGMTHASGSFCSGALVMNTCSENTPYVLTANHCMLDANSQVINPNSSTFEFLWISPTCSPTSNSSSLLFNGATIRSRWDQSDFALLQLNQLVPSNSGLAFAGWSRSATAPNASVGISHPLGDIMKIAIENDPASVGTILTFPNKAWRVVWDQGTVQPGSSGSPLFNLNHQVVGQLYSNTQPVTPPCNLPTGGSNYGRFDASWDGGGTSSTRLKDWLDPYNRNLTTTTTTLVSSLLTRPLSNVISGPDVICTAETYTVGSFPAGTTVTWSTIPASSYVSLSPSGNSVTATKVSDGTFQLVATINGGCFVLSKTIRAGNYSWPGMQIYGPTYVSCGEYVMYSTANQPGVYYDWYFPSDWTYGYGQGSYYIGLIAPTYPYTSNPVDIGYTAYDVCGTNYSYVTVYPACGARSVPHYYTISPNPAVSSVTVSIKDAGLKSVGPKGIAERRGIQEVRVYDAIGVLRRTQRFGKASTTVVNVTGLTPGVYFIEIIDGVNKERQPLVIVK